MTLWFEPGPVAVPDALRSAVAGHPLVAETLVRRGIRTADAALAFLDPRVYTPARPAELPDLAVAVERLRKAIDQGEQIAIWGDFDADGQTSTALLLETLQALGANVTYHIPGRYEGHGLHTETLGRLIAAGARLILTCDTGVMAHRAVAHANHFDADVIITDHHVPGEHLPPAMAVVNPHRLPTGHPMRTLTGVGVAYELAKALDRVAADHSLDLVALGMVADVATLTGDTRYLVQRGLEALRDTQRPGLLAVYERADLNPEGLTEEHIGFVLGPRLNALGRLADASHGVELLTTGDATRARMLATELEGLNAQRQLLTKQVTDAALTQIERDPSLLRDYQVLVLSHPAWPGGVIGIVAGRLSERFGRPAVLISAPEREIARGSGRSVPGVDLVAALTECSQLLESYGGHPGAAGFALESERIPQLRSALSRAIVAQVGAIPEPTLNVDAYVNLEDLTLDLVAELNRLAPFGPGNPSLTLAVRDLRILSDATIGRMDEHRRITVEDRDGRSQTVFWWHGVGWSLPHGRFDLALSLRASDYRGMPEVQVEWLDARVLEPETAQAESALVIEVRDFRGTGHPETLLLELLSQGELQVWAEGETATTLKPRSRLELAPGRRLAIWTTPPGPRELQAALTMVQPDELLLFAQDPGMDDDQAFLTRLAGLVKFALHNREGQVDLKKAAAATAQRQTTVQAGLQWLAAQGQVAIVDREDDHWQVTTGHEAADPKAAERELARLKALLAETAAYREYVRHAPAKSLTRPLSG